MDHSKARLAVVSPFVDKSHGTERCIAEWLSRLTEAFEIHLYSQHVEDLDLSRIIWHRIPKFPGPHLLNYLWWLAANHVWRAWDRRFNGLQPDLIYSPGINCLDANVISVHVVFAEYRRRNESGLRLANHSLAHWPRLLHRKLFHRLIAHLERRIYRDPRTFLILMSQRISVALAEFYGRREKFPVVYSGIDYEVFNPQVRMGLRIAARHELHLAEGQIALLLVGNDWRNKGLPTLLEALIRLRDLPVSLLVVGQDDSSPYRKIIDQNHLAERIFFLPPRKDIEFYYAAADVYVGPSREDAFGQPPGEAMACGLPIITAITCGVSEVVSPGEDGFVLGDPSDPEELVSCIRKLCLQPVLRERIGAKAAEKMREFTWERNGREMTEILMKVMEEKHSLAAVALRQEA